MLDTQHPSKFLVTKWHSPTKKSKTTYDTRNVFIKQNISMYKDMKPHIINAISCTYDGEDIMLLRVLTVDLGGA